LELLDRLLRDADGVGALERGDADTDELARPQQPIGIRDEIRTCNVPLFWSIVASTKLSLPGRFQSVPSASRI
jgi:hypothetical protein